MTSHPSAIISLKELDMNRWKVGGELVMPKNIIVGNESSFPLVSVLDSDVVIPPSYVKLGEDLGVFEFVDEV